MAGPEQGYLTARLPEIVAGLSPEQRQKDRIALERMSTNGHLAQVDPFWAEYRRVLNQQPRLTLAQAQEGGVERFQYGIESCVIQVARAVSVKTIRRRILKIGGSLQSGFDPDEEGRLIKGDLVLFHVHTDDPGEVLKYLGWLGKIQGKPLVENLEEQIRQAGIVRTGP